MLQYQLLKIEIFSCIYASQAEKILSYYFSCWAIHVSFYIYTHLYKSWHTALEEHKLLAIPVFK